MTVLSNLLDHKNVAIANIAWAVFHVWIAIEIEESMGFLAIVVLIGGIFGFAMISEEMLGRRVMLLPSLLYLLVLQRWWVPWPGIWSLVGMSGSI